MESSHNPIDNFSKLIKAKNIKIPVIQRDYAQGRQIESVNSIRENFIKSLLEAVNGQKIMDINYIYGIDKPGDEFMPIDGQQRLTSIYLFLWFCAVKEGKTRLFCEATKSFSYQVRDTSERFFDVLQKQENGDLAYLKDFEEYVNGKKETENGKEKVKKRSLDEFSWYKLGWNYDMTVCGAKTFLDAIREEMEGQGINDSNYTEALLDDENCPISLMLMIQNEAAEQVQHGTEPVQSKLEQENAAFEAENRAAITYINMNARGKVLNDFENMKAMLSKTGEKAKAFIGEYDNRYINVFLSFVAQEDKEQDTQVIYYIQRDKPKKTKRSLSEKVERMDAMTLNFIKNVYQDLKILAVRENEGKTISYYEFLDFLREGGAYPEEYFSFMEFVLKRLCSAEASPEEKKLFYDYCKDERDTIPQKVPFYAYFWEKYRGVDEDPYWEILKKHLHTLIRIDIKTLKCLVKLIDLIAASMKNDPKRVLKFMKGTAAKPLFDCITEKGLQYQGILSLAALQEEIIKARLILYPNPGITEEEKIAEIEAMSENRENIRYLLYLTGLWDGTVGPDSWSGLRKYGNLGRSVFPLDKTLDWEKMYYLSGLSVENTVFVLPTQNCHTRWEDRILSWEKLEIEPGQKAQLNRVKQCFDRMLQDNITVTQYIEQERSSLGASRTSWLYYLLNRSYADLLDNSTRQNGQRYVRSGWDYYEYVLKRDLEQKHLYVIYNGFCIKENYESSQLRHVPKRPGDGNINDKNMNVKLTITYEMPDDGKVYFEKDASIYRYGFVGFNQDGEDCFVLEQDVQSIPDAETEFEMYCKMVGAIIDNYTDDECYQMVFKGDCRKLAEDMGRKMQEQGLDVDVRFGCRKEGQNNIVIRIEKRISFRAVSQETQSAIPHDELLTNLCERN